MSRSTGKLSGEERRGSSGTFEALFAETLRRRDDRAFGVCRTCRFFQAGHAEGSPHRCGLLEVSLSAADSKQICAEQEPVG